MLTGSNVRSKVGIFPRSQVSEMKLTNARLPSLAQWRNAEERVLGRRFQFPCAVRFNSSSTTVQLEGNLRRSLKKEDQTCSPTTANENIRMNGSERCTGQNLFCSLPSSYLGNPDSHESYG